MWTSLYPPDRYPLGHPAIATTLTELGGVALELGNERQGLELALRGLAMRESLYPKERYPRGHPDLTVSFYTLGQMHIKVARYATAREYLQRSFEMNQSLYPEGHPNLAADLNDLACVLEALGDHDEAKKYFQRTLEAYHKVYPVEVYPDGHPHLAVGMANLAMTFLQDGDRPSAWSLVSQAMVMCNKLDEIFVAAASEAESLDYLVQSKPIRDDLICCSAGTPGNGDAVYAHIWRRKSLIARMLAHRQAALVAKASSDPEVRQRLADWIDRRREIAGLMAGADSPTPSHRLERLQQLTREKEQLERQLADSLPEFAREQRLKQSPHGDLIKVLPDRTVIVDLVQYARRDRAASEKGDAGVPAALSYVGFILSKNRAVQMVDLGPAPPIDGALRAWRERIAKERAGPPRG